MPRIESAHGRAGAEFRVTEPLVDHLIFRRDETIIEVHIVSRKDCVAHEISEPLGNFDEERRIGHHLRRDIGDARNVGWYGALRIEQSLKLVDNLSTDYLYRTNFGQTMQTRSTAGRFDIDDDIGLVGIDRPADLHNPAFKSGGRELPHACQLVSPYGIA